MPESIQQWLEGVGFCLSDDHFHKVVNIWGGSIQIPYTELAGHTLTSFKEYALKKQWVSEEEVKTGKPEEYPLWQTDCIV